MNMLNSNLISKNVKSRFFLSGKKFYALIAFTFVITICNSQWVQQTSGVTLPLYSVYFMNADTGWASTGNHIVSGIVAKTTNGGANWTSYNSGLSSAIIYSVYFVDADTGFVVGDRNAGAAGYDGATWKSIDGGATWTLIMTGGSNVGALNSVYFPTLQRGYSVGVGGRIKSTSDCGDNWIPQTSGVSQTLNSVYFPARDTGYIAGDNGTILRTFDGGANWLPQISGTTRNLKSIYFIDLDTGFAVGFSGNILKTIDGGTNWISTPSGTSFNLNSVHFWDAFKGYVVGDSGLVLKTGNGGLSWSPELSTITSQLNSVCFGDANTAYAVGATGRIIKHQPSSVAIASTNLDDNIIIFPNPATNQLTIDNKQYTIKEIKIYNLLGECVLQSAIHNPQSEMSLDISGVNKGIYFVEITDEKKNVINKKIVIQ